jgi:hypothetical protein
MQSAPSAPGAGAPQSGVWGTSAIAGGVAAALTSSSRPQQVEEEEHEEHPVGGQVRSDGTFDMTTEQQESVVALARTFSRSAPDLAPALSRTSTEKTRVDFDANPFLGTTDPELDPNSGQFSVRKWMKTIVGIASRDPELYPTRTAGVSWKGLNVYGYGTDTDFQSDVWNVWIKMFNSLKHTFGLGHAKRITILQDFEGLVKSGEMLVVLGRPGRSVEKLYEWDVLLN